MREPLNNTQGKVPMRLALLSMAAATLLPLTAMAQDGPGTHFLQSWDLDENGVVTPTEAEERRGDVFLTFDAGEDQFLDAEEYALFDEARANDMENMGNGHGMQNAQKGMTLVFNDIDADGLVSRDEFIARTADWIQLLDRDADGGVTAADFGPAKN
jgi:hypothetical protein